MSYHRALLCLAPLSISSVHSFIYSFRKCLRDISCYFKCWPKIRKYTKNSCPLKACSLVEIEKAAEKAQHALGTPAALPDDLDSIPSTHGSLQASCDFSPWEPDFLVWPLQAPGVHMVHRRSWRQPTYTQKYRFNLKKEIV